MKDAQNITIGKKIYELGKDLKGWTCSASEVEKEFECKERGTMLSRDGSLVICGECCSLGVSIFCNERRKYKKESELLSHLQIK